MALLRHPDGADHYSTHVLQGAVELFFAPNLVCGRADVDEGYYDSYSDAPSADAGGGGIFNYGGVSSKVEKRIRAVWKLRPANEKTIGC
jgi:hypothetical protein